MAVLCWCGRELWELKGKNDYSMKKQEAEGMDSSPNKLEKMERQEHYSFLFCKREMGVSSCH